MPINNSQQQQPLLQRDQNDVDTQMQRQSDSQQPMQPRNVPGTPETWAVPMPPPEVLVVRPASGPNTHPATRRQQDPIPYA